MGKFKGLFCAVAALSALMAAGAVRAEDEPVAELETVVVTADRWGQREEDATGRITSIDKEGVEKTPARDAGEALNYMPGVVMGRGGAGGAHSPVFPSAQGAEYYQTPVMINGIPFSDMLNGLGNLGVIPAELIQRIEVAHGAGGMEWGSTQGGLINLSVIAPDRARKNSFTIGGGQHGTFVGGVDAQHWTENVGLSLGASRRAADGPEKDASKLENASGVFGVKALFGEQTKLEGSAYSFRGVTGTGEYRGDAAGYYEKLNYGAAGGGITLQTALGGAGLRLTGYTQTLSARVDQFSVEEGKTGEVKSGETLTGGSVILHGDLGFAEASLGADAKSGTSKSTGLSGEKYSINQSGVFAHLSRKAGGWTLQGGGRSSSEDYFGNFTAFGAGVKYAFQGAPVDVRVSAARGYSNPPLSFRYLAIPEIWAPNPDLKVEEAVTFQAQAFARLAEGLTLDANYFSADLTDALGVEARPDGLTWYRNFARAQRNGVEAEIRYEAHGVDLFANTLSQTVKDKDTGQAIHGKPRAAHSFGAGYLFGRLYVQLSGIWRDWNELPDNRAKDKVFIFGGKALYKVELSGKTLNITLTVNNLTDAEYWNHHFSPKNDPRDVEAAVQYIF